MPKHDALQPQLQPADAGDAFKAINDLVVEAAVKLGLEDGSKLRVDTTVVETDIHHPTDSTLLWDVVRVLTRLLGRFGKNAGAAAHRGFSQSLARRAPSHVRDSTDDDAG